MLPFGEIPGISFNSRSWSNIWRQRGRVHIGARSGRVEAFGPDISSARHSEKTVSLTKNIPCRIWPYRDAPAPQGTVEFDRQSLARQGIAMETAQKTLEMALAGNIATTCGRASIRCRCVCVCLAVDRMTEERIRNIAIPLPNGGSVPLHSVGAVSIKIW